MEEEVIAVGCPILILMPTLRPRQKWEGLLLLLQDECRDGDEVRVILEPGGYWNVMNAHLPPDLRSPFLCFQDDTEPKTGFLDIARAAWLEHYPSGAGLLALNDENVCHGGATYAMTSRIWLWVMFGQIHFPAFWHNYLDTLLADRSKDLGRYTYVPKAVCRHMHPSLGLSERDEVYESVKQHGRDDFALKNAFDRAWRDGERASAEQRMQAVDAPGGTWNSTSSSPA